MAFTSLEYPLFLIVVFLLYWLLCKRSKTLQNALLVAASLFFYACWDWRCLALLLLTALSTFAMGGRMQRQEGNDRGRKATLIASIALNVGILFFFKYYNFFVHSFADAFSLFGKSLSVSTLRIVLPVGISFYTLTAIGYCIDVYQRKIAATRDLLAYLAYVIFFPSILSGPISRAQKQLPQYLVARKFDYDKCVSACKMILWGGVLKLCLADRLGIYVDAVYANIPQHNGTTLLLASVCYTLQIYADFAGYSLMAIGSGLLLGIELPTNFVRPYFARTVTEFWRRWHMSLTTWFRDYIYFPMGGNRVSKARWMLNTMVVFLVSGLWHGAAYTFLVWGALHGLCMIAEKLIYGHKMKTMREGLTVPNVLRMLLTFAIVNCAWIFFRAQSLGEAWTVVGKIFTTHGSLFIEEDSLVYSALFALLLFLVEGSAEFFNGKMRLANSHRAVVRWCTYLVLAAMIVLCGVLDGGSFIYSRF